jgi:hypothetical protein
MAGALKWEAMNVWLGANGKYIKGELDLMCGTVGVKAIL